MIKQRTIAISMAAMALTACAHQGLQSSALTRSETTPLASYGNETYQTEQNRTLAFLQRRNKKDDTERHARAGPDGPSNIAAPAEQETISSRASISLL
ncbi:MAG: hypothetical protein AB8B60_03095 [Sulfitobacter sp.]